MKSRSTTTAALAGLTVAFLALAAAFYLNLWGRPATLSSIPPVDPRFTNTATVRVAYPDLVRTKADLSDFDCYGCHEKGKPMQLRFDTNYNVIVPEVHQNIVMGHGRHKRNNNCFNCHDETNLEQLQTRDGHAVKFSDSAPLCGSCHGPTYRDWDAGAHGRTSSYWDRALGPMDRKACVSCHNPHAPRFPPQKPAPGPHPLHSAMKTAQAPPEEH